MNYFLLIYDRGIGRLLDLREYRESDRELAFMERLRLEEQYVDRPEIEVVVLGAESKEALTRTHLRYFKNFHEQLEGFRRAAS